MSFNEQVAWIKGSHSLKFGFILMRDYYARKDCNECGNGDVTFNPIVTGLREHPGRLVPRTLAFCSGCRSPASIVSAAISIQHALPRVVVQDDFK